MNPLTPLTKIAEEFESRARPEEQSKKNVIEQNRESMAQLTAMMSGVRGKPRV